MDHRLLKNAQAYARITQHTRDRYPSFQYARILTYSVSARKLEPWFARIYMSSSVQIVWRERVFSALVACCNDTCCLLLATCVGFCIRTNKRHQQHNQRHLLPECANITRLSGMPGICPPLLQQSIDIFCPGEPTAANLQQQYLLSLCVSVVLSVYEKSRYCIEMTGRIKLAFGMGAFLPTMLKEIRVSPK